MSNLLAYSGLTTKVRAMESNLITHEMFTEMAGLSSVTEVVNYIGNLKSYKDIFSSVDVNGLHRGDLERYLLLSSYKDFSKLYNFASVKQRKYLEIYFMRYETHILKQVFRELTDKHKVIMDLSVIKPYFERFSDLDLDAISKSTSVDECVLAISNTQYAAPLKHIHDLGSNPSLFDYELALDLLYFETMWNSRDKYLKGIDHKVITEAYGYKIDLLNLQWIYRSKKYYNLKPAQIYSMLIPVNYKLSKAQIKQLVNVDNISAMSEMLKSTYYGKTYNDSELNDNSYETMYETYLNKIYSLSFRNNPYSLACVNTYLHQKNQEIAKLISLTECVRYSLPVSEINDILYNSEVK